VPRGAPDSLTGSLRQDPDSFLKVEIEVPPHHHRAVHART